MLLTYLLLASTATAFNEGDVFWGHELKANRETPTGNTAKLVISNVDQRLATLFIGGDGRKGTHLIVGERSLLGNVNATLPDRSTFVCQFSEYNASFVWGLCSQTNDQSTYTYGLTKQPPATPAPVPLRAKDAAQTLQAVYFGSNSTGTWDYCDKDYCGQNCFWQTANALEALINFISWSGDRSYESAIPVVFKAAQQKLSAGGWKNDDQLWWCLAYARTYEHTRNMTYLNAAVSIWQKVQQNWDDKCGGGVYWDNQKDYKNAVTNEQFLSASTTLYRLTNDSTYLEWAQKEWNWFESTGGRVEVYARQYTDVTSRAPCTQTGFSLCRSHPPTPSFLLASQSITTLYPAP
jgi:hypothetical protein